MKLRRCPRCGRDEGLVYCPSCHAPREARRRRVEGTEPMRGAVMPNEKQVEVTQTQVSVPSTPEDGQAATQTPAVPVVSTETHIPDAGKPQTGGPDKD